MQQTPVILQTKHWTVQLNKDQRYLGRCVIEAKAPDRPSLTSLTSEEWHDFSTNIVPVLEAALKRTFGAELFNWSCNMNLAYQTTPPTPHVHWHVRPRYRHPVEFAGITFHDDAFGKHYLTDQPFVVEEQTLLQIADAISEHLA